MSVNRNPLTPLPRFVVNLLHNLFLHLCESWQAFDWHCASHGPSAVAQLLVTQVSGVARNFRQGMRQSVAFVLSVHSRSAALPSRVSLIDKFYCVFYFRLLNFSFFIYVVLPHTLVKVVYKNIGTSARFYAKVYNTVKSHTKKLCIFLTGGAYVPYATCMATPLTQDTIQKHRPSMLMHKP